MHARPRSCTNSIGPVFGASDAVEPGDDDLTRQHDGEPLGERIIVSGRVARRGRPPGPRTRSSRCGRPTPRGRYRHDVDHHPAPLDPNFTGAGRCLTDDEGRYRFVTIKPGAYPWGNHDNAWRPAHIHFSLFGRAFTAAARDADVLPRRSAVRLRPDLQLGSRPEARATLLISQLRPRARPCPTGRSATALDIVLGRGGSSTPRGDESEDAVSDRRPVLLDRPLQASLQRTGASVTSRPRCD